MKKIYQSLIIAGMAFSSFTLIGCQDFLTEDPKGQMVVDNFFQTKGDLDKSLNAMYGILANAMYANNAIGFDAVRGDDISTTLPVTNSLSAKSIATMCLITILG